MNSNILYDKIVSKIENSIYSNNLFYLIINNKFNEIINDINIFKNKLNDYKIDNLSLDKIYNKCCDINFIQTFKNYDDFINNQIDNFYLLLANSFIKNNNNYLYYFLIFKIYKDLEKINNDLLLYNNKFIVFKDNLQDNFNYYFVDLIKEKYDKKIKDLFNENEMFKKTIIIFQNKIDKFNFYLNFLIFLFIFLTIILFIKF